MAALRSVGKFIEFGSAILVGLVRAVAHDIDVFLLALSAAFLSFGPTRWVGLVFLVYTVFRRLDQYVAAITTKADSIFRLIGDDSDQRDS